MNREKKPVSWRLLLSLAALIVVVLLFPTTHKQSTRVGYMESGGWSRWSAHYRSLDGSLARTLRPRGQAYRLTVTTEEGSLGIAIVAGEDILFSEDNLPTGSWTLTLSGTARVTVTADHHRGGFSLTPVQ